LTGRLYKETETISLIFPKEKQPTTTRSFFCFYVV